jgi:hypothetical protein
MMIGIIVSRRSNGREREMASFVGERSFGCQKAEGGSDVFHVAAAFAS